MAGPPDTACSPVLVAALVGHSHDLQGHKQLEEHFVPLIEAAVHVSVHLGFAREVWHFRFPVVGGLGW